MHEAALRMSLRALPRAFLPTTLTRTRDISSLTSGLRTFGAAPALKLSGKFGALVSPHQAWVAWSSAGTRAMSTAPAKIDDEEREQKRIQRLIAAKQKREQEKMTIRATTRAEGCIGTKASVALRKTGYVPGRLQDTQGTNELLQVLSKSVRRWTTEARALSTVFQLYVDDRPPVPVIIRELQTHYVHYDEPMHVTMLKYEDGVDYTIEIPVSLVNQDKSPGLRIGGALNLNMRTIQVQIKGGTPIPPRVEVDLSGLEVGDRIFLRDVKLPEGIVMADLPHYKTISLVRVAKTRASMGLV